jgi:hypothetical protein
MKRRAGGGCRGRGLGIRGGLGRGWPLLCDFRLGLDMIESASFLLFLPGFLLPVIYLNLKGLVFHVGSEVVD